MRQGNGVRVGQIIPDVVLLGVDWQSRALIRAQLIEEGYEVVAIDTWPDMRRHLRPGSRPRLALVDLYRMPNPEEILDALRILMKPDRVLLLTAIGTLSDAELERFGFRALHRPIAIEEIVHTVRELLSR